LGLVLGRVFWTLFADTLGVASDSSLPIGPALLAIPVTLGVTVLVAAIPARFARRTRPAVVLRAL
jgi:ABC-type antimicrobial peptide transport system permease subunit